MQKLLYIFLNFIPTLLMIGLIPIVHSDVRLLIVDVGIVILALLIRNDRKDLIVLFFGFLVLTFSEWIFVSTGVEKFTRHSLFGIMPIWLPVLWGYAFVAIKRAVLAI